MPRRPAACPACTNGVDGRADQCCRVRRSMHVPLQYICLHATFQKCQEQTEGVPQPPVHDAALECIEIVDRRRATWRQFGHEVARRVDRRHRQTRSLADSHSNHRQADGNAQPRLKYPACCQVGSFSWLQHDWIRTKDNSPQTTHGQSPCVDVLVQNRVCWRIVVITVATELQTGASRRQSVLQYKPAWPLPEQQLLQELEALQPRSHTLANRKTPEHSE